MKPAQLTEGRMPMDLAHVRAGGWLWERIERGMVAVDNLFGSLWWHGSGWGALPGRVAKYMHFGESQLPAKT